MDAWKAGCGCNESEVAMAQMAMTSAAANKQVRRIVAVFIVPCERGVLHMWLLLPPGQVRGFDRYPLREDFRQKRCFVCYVLLHIQMMRRAVLGALCCIMPNGEWKPTLFA